jgi:hypothetical protein
MTEKEKRDLLGEYRNRVTGEERLKVTISMPLWLKIYIWKESKEKGIPVWEYLAKIMEENREMKREDKNQYIFKLKDVIRELTVDLENYKRLSENRGKTIELLKRIIIDIKDACGDCARQILLRYREKTAGKQDEVQMVIAKFIENIL